VRRACADVVSVAAKFTLPSGDWPALLPFLHQCSQVGAFYERRNPTAVSR
jgi:hypothetical protein